MKSLLRLMTGELKHDLVNLYPYLPDTLKILISRYVRHLDVGNQVEAEREVDREIEAIFNRIHEFLRRVQVRK